MTGESLKSLVGELEAKAWQSSSRRNSAGGLARHSDHVCWRAAARIKELEEALSTHTGDVEKLRADLAWIAEQSSPLTWADMERRLTGINYRARRAALSESQNP